MTITQRIELRRLGYSKDEIAELAAAEAAAAAQPEPEPAPAAEDQAPAAAAQPEPAPAVTVAEPAAAGMNQPSMADVLTAINNLTTALQKQNINSIPQPVEPQPETATDIFTNLLKG